MYCQTTLDAPQCGLRHGGLFLHYFRSHACVKCVCVACVCVCACVSYVIRIPDDHVSFCVNYFVIRALDLSRPDWYLASPNVFDVAAKMGFWQRDQPFDFAKAYHHHTTPHLTPCLAQSNNPSFALVCILSYSNPVPPESQHFAHRTWRIINMWAPSTNLSYRLDHLDYPFSFKVHFPFVWS